MSLQQLAAQSDVSAAAIHKIERGGMVPTITTLLKIAGAFNRPVSYFVEAQQGENRPVAHIRRTPAAPSSPPTGASTWPASPGPTDGSSSPAPSPGQPGANSGDKPMEHPGEELILVLDGSFELDVDGQHFVLERATRCTSAPTVRTAGTTPATSPPRPCGWRCGRSDPRRCPARSGHDAAVRVTINGVNLPGRTFCRPDGSSMDNVHVGVQLRRDPAQLVRADAPEAHWEVEVQVVDPTGVDGPDFRGPAVQGKRGERFLYLTWGDVGPDGEFEMFRRAKLMLDRVDPEVMESATRTGIPCRHGRPDGR